MCGLFGLISPNPPASRLIETVHALQAHRGPDDRGSWQGRFGRSHLTLAAQRLAIIDLSPNGAQPFHSAATGSTLVFNGEIYNYVELRAELKSAGIVFHTASDTEVLLAALDHYGIDEALDRLNGMFAFAWLCGRTGRLKLARDRVGEKPLYWWRDGPTLAFASEIKTLLAVVADRAIKPNLRIVRNFLVDGIVDDSEETFFTGINTLRPSQYAEVVPGDDTIELQSRDYWPRRPEGIGSSRHCLSASAEECLSLLKDAVRIRLRSDVPIGFMLSGGIDSSILTALAFELGADRTTSQSFSVVNPHVEEDETRWIDLMAKHLGITVNKITFNPDGEDLLQRLDSQVYVHDEPLTGLAVLAHAEIMNQARARGVTVLLSGQGGDELFCGYAKYLYFYIQWLLREGRLADASRLAWSFFRNGTVFPSFSAADAARYVSIPLPGVTRLPLGRGIAKLASTDIGLSEGDVGKRQIADLMRFSAPAINHIEDRTSMAMSREVRSPFFDRRMMDFALALPPDQKIGDGWTKRVLRLAGRDLLPPETTWRKDKIGHFTATRPWLIGRGGAVLKNQLNPKSPIFTSGYLDAGRMMPLWNAFWTGGRSGLSVPQIVRILTMDVWLRKFSRSLSL